MAYCAGTDIPELTALARTIGSWRVELLAYFTTGGISNGPTEAINLLIKKIKRVARGYRNFDHYRLRPLLNHGRMHKDHSPTRIRTRRPRVRCVAPVTVTVVTGAQVTESARAHQATEAT